MTGHFDHFNDDLDAVIASPLKSGEAKPPSNYRPATFDEPCSKCSGTGVWRTWAGNGRQCFACNGTGKKSFATPRADREKAKLRRETRAVQGAMDNAAAFAAQHPAIWAWLVASPNFEFAASLKAGVEKFGSLTEKQLAAAEKCVVKRAARDEQRAVEAPAIAVDKIAEAFATASANGLKWPKLRLGEFTFSPAPAHGKNYGAIYVKRGDDYQGKIAGGKFFAVSTCEASEAILAAAADPHAAAVAHGLRTGSCACCGRELTDPVSVAAGIGPICAGKFGW